MAALSSTTAADAAPAPVTATFGFTGSAQSWLVPAGVTSITVDAIGAAGGNCGQPGSTVAGGPGGEVVSTLTVYPGRQIQINVGGRGGNCAQRLSTLGQAVLVYGHGGFNGGGNGGSEVLWLKGDVLTPALIPVSLYGAAGGGGATDVRVGGSGLTNRAIVAGGGGGASMAISGNVSAGYPGGTGGSTAQPAGGQGGGRVVVAPRGTGGGGALTTAVGIGGMADHLSNLNPFVCTSDGHNGVNATGGAGGGNCADVGGGGGGGLYGGGGGGAGNASAGGGGGGSALVPAGAQATPASNTGNGFVRITYVPPTTPVGGGGVNLGGASSSGIGAGIGGATILLTKSSNLASGAAVVANEPVVYAFTLTNTGSVPVTPTALTDTRLDGTPVSVACAVGCSATINPGASVTYIATGVVTAADLIRGYLGDTAQATVTAPWSGGWQTVVANTTLVIPIHAAG